jgi:CheY-like chemotaxis protein
MSDVLIAEDNAINRELLRELLEARGHTVVEACNGQEALDALKQAQPDILLLDINMPVMDGFTAVRKIRENPHLATLPILAVTANVMLGEREKILNSGFDGYLPKPINARALTEEVERLLSERRSKNNSEDRSQDLSGSGKTRAADVTRSSQ